MAKVIVSTTPLMDIVTGPLKEAVSFYVALHEIASDSAVLIATGRGHTRTDFVSAQAALGFHQLVWSMLLACGSDDFDPVDFGHAAERIARETIPVFVQHVERHGATQQ
jgi:hypothetical protein